ncbi:MAG: DNA repair protein RecO [Candidatus Yanofskybacteria bacterium RIFCSPHIGHO2_02_FULL_41_29]|uniref:DNA repair protein RecO n=1 Tax=Candidatus Yanofskybacteria bacterium RIFCSPHIGHO2_01_FULL_41_53 TaxID=1802663 RepID=A0A1F8ELW5_9BACT|nr:MAG: DNA repair protein RecO [Candidatus Yanofskybacteria bacterium RIFCSPHIGHO2_01_FULL_41_53]OGN12195.1 MAG: DNA repair protein RecO [Candidatus Yanofskybacteria bacterium RIFCSPHIGHO2_02_FULL_41_29]OGN17634.1 MAG: DNA repair protein RecO [Candidatus Yanofskybacteria bacterium RIFCSPHIGHO2_12_FULL_41_9]OGN23809.1 MAG: DNA repair protein RecO [Candidatus Yanofskybacteria bacterium RIFCSPLOWO2_01_FULL_41_67]OGN28545.1 MAG: DNA repair protein RecO [Candidatus Yanofskybacteria bacterium RIFCSP
MRKVDYVTMRTLAIILKKQATNEYDQLVTCYTQEFGKLTAVAKSVLKPNSIQAMHLDVFNLVDFELISGRGTPIITGAQAENSYTNIKSDLSCLAVVYLFAEIIDKLAFEYQKDEGMWNFLVSLPDHFNQGRPLVDIRRILPDKQLELLNILGYAPNLKECVFCQKTELIAYNVQARGGVCKDCFLAGRGGIVAKGNDLMSTSVLNSIFESLIERKLYSLNLSDFMLR